MDYFPDLHQPISFNSNVSNTSSTLVLSPRLFRTVSSNRTAILAEGIEMQPRQRASILLLLSLCVPLVSCVRRQSAVRPPSIDPVEVAREYRQNHDVAGVRATGERPLASTGGMDADEIYNRQIQNYFNLRNFD